jgi:hypothetical protein
MGKRGGKTIKQASEGSLTSFASLTSIEFGFKSYRYPPWAAATNATARKPIPPVQINGISHFSTHSLLFTCAMSVSNPVKYLLSDCPLHRSESGGILPVNCRDSFCQRVDGFEFIRFFFLAK